MDFLEINEISMSKGPFLTELHVPTIPSVVYNFNEIDYNNLSTNDLSELIEWSKTQRFTNYKRHTPWRNVMKELIMNNHTRHFLKKNLN